MLALGVFLLLAAAAASVPLLDPEMLERLAEDTDCGGRTCEDELRTLLTAAVVAGGALGGPLTLAGLVSAVRRRGESVGMADLRDEVGDRRMEQLALLDEAYGRGEIDGERYLALRERLMGPGSR